MIYLDYSATTPVNSDVLNTFVTVTKNFIGNPNSLHKLGLEANRLINASTSHIASILGVHDDEIIYTSGATEANNSAIYGVLDAYKERGKEIITTHLEHSSINESLKYAESIGYKVIYVNLDKDGYVDLHDLKNKINNNTCLVTISSVNSETGVHQDIESISKIVKEYPRCVFYSDMTQSIGKVRENLKYVDLASFSAQKFYGLKGIGVLIKKENVSLTPLIKGGKSTTRFRAGTPSAALIASCSKALTECYKDFDKKYEHVLSLNKYLREKIDGIPGVYINSPSSAIPHILNVSVMNIKPETILHALEEKDIYISTRTACSLGDYSEAVYALTGDMERAKHSIRISLSYLTTKEEIDVFICEFKHIIKDLNLNI